MSLFLFTLCQVSSISNGESPMPPVSQKPQTVSGPNVGKSTNPSKPVTPTKVTPTTTTTPVVPKKGGDTPEAVAEKKLPIVKIIRPKRKTVYPKVEAIICTGKDALTLKQVKQLLGWETEEEFAKRMMIEDSKLKEEQCRFGEKYLFKDITGQKVNCWNNDQNRPFTEAWARSLCQDFLTKNWAGSTYKDNPEDTINGEAVIIGKTGLILSAQHRLIGFVLACQIWAGKNKAHWLTIWPEEPTFPTVKVTGISESQRTVSTLDNVRPRSLSDVVYTSDVFRDLDSVEHRKCSRMMDSAIDMLWKRTGMSTGNRAMKYQTHSASMDFMRQHPRLQTCVRHLFEEDADNSLSKLKLSVGQCAALMYMMGSCISDDDTYRLVDSVTDRNETSLNWDMEAKATSFWTLLADTKDPTFEVVRKARRPAVGDENTDKYSGYLFTGGDENSTSAEKIAVICKAWNLFSEDKEITSRDLRLSYKFQLADDGSVLSYTLIDKTGQVGGIDLGDLKVEVEDPTIEEIEAGTGDHPPVDESPEQEKARRDSMKPKKNGILSFSDDNPKSPEAKERSAKAEELSKRLRQIRSNRVKKDGSDESTTVGTQPVPNSSASTVSTENQEAEEEEDIDEELEESESEPEDESEEDDNEDEEEEPEPEVEEAPAPPVQKPKKIVRK